LQFWVISRRTYLAATAILAAAAVAAVVVFLLGLLPPPDAPKKAPRRSDAGPPAHTQIAEKSPELLHAAGTGSAHRLAARSRRVAARASSAPT